MFVAAGAGTRRVSCRAPASAMIAKSSRALPQYHNPAPVVHRAFMLISASPAEGSRCVPTTIVTRRNYARIVAGASEVANLRRYAGPVQFRWLLWGTQVRGLEGRVISQIEQIVSRKGVFPSLVEAMRLHQWAKNVLVFVPLILAGKTESLEAWIPACSASSPRHPGVVHLSPERRARSSVRPPSLVEAGSRAGARRPAGAGGASRVGGIGVVVSFTLAATLNSDATRPGDLRRVDGGLFALAQAPADHRRVPAGLPLHAAAVLRHRAGRVAASPWLLVFSMFVFLSLSLAKRYTEVGRGARLGRETVEGRGYVAKDAPLIFGLGLSTAAGAVLIMVLYLINEAFGATFYRRRCCCGRCPACCSCGSAASGCWPAATSSTTTRSASPCAIRSASASAPRSLCLRHARGWSDPRSTGSMSAASLARKLAGQSHRGRGLPACWAAAPSTLYSGRCPSRPTCSATSTRPTTRPPNSSEEGAERHLAADGGRRRRLRQHPDHRLAVRAARDAGRGGSGWAFLAIGAVAALAAWWLLARMRARRRNAAPLLLFLGLVNGPMINSLREGNTTHIILLLLVLALLLWRSGCDSRPACCSASAPSSSCRCCCSAPTCSCAASGAWRWAASRRSPRPCCCRSPCTACKGNIAWYKDSVEPFLGGVIPAFNVQSIDGFLVRLETGPARLLDWEPLAPTLAQDRPQHRAVRCSSAASGHHPRLTAARRARGRSSATRWIFSIVLVLAIVTSPVSWTHYYLCFCCRGASTSAAGCPARRRDDALADVRAAVLASLPVDRAASLRRACSASCSHATVVSAWFFGGLLMLAALLAALWMLEPVRDNRRRPRRATRHATVIANAERRMPVIGLAHARLALFLLFNALRPQRPDLARRRRRSSRRPC